MKVEFKNLEIVFKELEKIDKERIIKAVTQKTYENVKKLAKPHYKTGKLETSIKFATKTEAGIVKVGDDNMLVNWKGKKINYVEFVLYGTRPHEIKPKPPRKALRIEFQGLDKFIFRKKVNHPGYKGDDFLKKAIEKTLKELDDIVKGV